MTTTSALSRKEIKQDIFRLIVPMILENILQISAGLISTAMIGRLLAGDVSAQGICIRITDTLWCLYKGISIGATILIARAYGAGEHSRCRRVTEQTLLTEIPVALFFTVLLFFFSAPVLSFFTKEADILVKAQSYMGTIVLGFPFVVIMSVVTASFQGCGDTKTPMVIAALVNVVNIVAGGLLIFVFPMGIRGAAISLVLSQAFGAIVGVLLLYRKKSLYSQFPHGMRFFSVEKECVCQIYTTGVPAALESMFWQFSAILLSKMILSYGQASFAAYQIGIQAETITEMPAIGFGTAATTLIARAIGKQDDSLRKTYFKELIGLSFQISAATSLLLILLPGVFMSIMTTNPELKPIGAGYVFVMGFIQIPQNLSRIYSGAMRAAGYKKLPMLIAGFGIWVVRIPLCFLITWVLHWDIFWIWLIIAVDQISRFVISATIYHRLEHTAKEL